jgi:isoleucyl-tRNA synthetase
MYMDDYEPTLAARVVEQFVSDDLSNWYVRLSRRRFWKSESSSDKQAAFETLFECLMVSTQLMASLAPFMAEWLYRNLTNALREKSIKIHSPLRHESVHLSDLVQAEHDLIDSRLERRMDLAQRVSSLVLSLRKAQKIRVRQPLQQILIPVVNKHMQSDIDKVAELIKSEVNVKEINFIESDTGLVKKKAKPNFRTLGKKLGKHMKEAAELISQFGNDQIDRLDAGEDVMLSIDSVQYSILKEDIEVMSEDIPGWLVSHDGNLTVALDINITEDLLSEGYARELINRIQNIRKEKNFNVTDRIHVSLELNDDLSKATQKFRGMISNEVLADSLEFKNIDYQDKMEWLNDTLIGIKVQTVQ